MQHCQRKNCSRREDRKRRYLTRDFLASNRIALVRDGHPFFGRFVQPLFPRERVYSDDLLSAVFDGLDGLHIFPAARLRFSPDRSYIIC